MATKQIQVRADEELAAAVDAAVKERGIVKNDFLIYAIRRELQAKEPQAAPAPAPFGDHNALILEVVTATFKYLLPLRDELDPDEAEAIKDLFARCRAAASQP